MGEDGLRQQEGEQYEQENEDAHELACSSGFSRSSGSRGD